MADPRMPENMIEWMTTRRWGGHHDEWHFTRRWDFWHALAAQGRPGTQEMINYAVSQGWTRAARQEGEGGNGSDFLLMHRAMLVLLRRDFSQQASLLFGWPTPPTDPNDTDDPVTPPSPFDPNMLAAITILESQPNIFATDDEFGLFCETNLRPVAGNPLNRSTDPRTGIHNYLHNRWTDDTSPINLGDPTVNIFNQRFWRLHGWIDIQWGRFRIAKGLSDTDAQYQQQLQAYVQMMDAVHAPHPHHHPAVTHSVPRPPGFAWSFRE